MVDTYKIGEFSKWLQVTTKMLKYYDSAVLLNPCKLEQSSGYQYYKVAAYPVSKIRTHLDMVVFYCRNKGNAECQDNTARFDNRIEELKELEETNARWRCSPL